MGPGCIVILILRDAGIRISAAHANVASVVSVIWVCYGGCAGFFRTEEGGCWTVGVIVVPRHKADVPCLAFEGWKTMIVYETRIS